MSRIRTIKPDFWTDEKVVTLSPLARLAFIGLWNFVDDFGRVPCSPVKMKMQILPADNADFRQLLEEISVVGLVTIYTIDDKQYLQVNGFDKHQKIDLRTKSKHPAPPNPPDIRPDFPLEGKGMEGNGREGKSAGADAPPPTAEVDYFRRAKEVCGPTAGGLAKKLLAAKDGNIALARAAIEQASTKQEPREYLGAIIRNRDGPTAEQGRSF